MTATALDEAAAIPRTPAATKVNLRVASKVTAAEGVVVVTLTHPSGDRLPDWTPGSHIDLMLPGGITRQYSLCGDRWDAHSYRIGVLREPDGRGGSGFVHDELGVGDTVGMGGPRNHFAMHPAPRYLFIAGGIGITPLLPMIDQAERVGAEWNLLYGGRRRASMAFLDELQSYGERVLVVPQDEAGLLDLASWLSVPDPVSKIYACGPAPLLAAVENACGGWPERALHIERFAAKSQGAPVRSAAFDVRLARTNQLITVPPQDSILDVVRAAGVNVLSSCREGTCGTCEVGVLEGQPDHRDSILSDDERADAGCMFICVSRSCSDELVLDL